MTPSIPSNAWFFVAILCFALCLIAMIAAMVTLVVGRRAEGQEDPVGDLARQGWADPSAHAVESDSTRGRRGIVEEMAKNVSGSYETKPKPLGPAPKRPEAIKPELPEAEPALPQWNPWEETVANATDATLATVAVPQDSGTKVTVVTLATDPGAETSPAEASMTTAMNIEDLVARHLLGPAGAAPVQGQVPQVANAFAAKPSPYAMTPALEEAAADDAADEDGPMPTKLWRDMWSDLTDPVEAAAPKVKSLPARPLSATDAEREERSQANQQANEKMLQRPQSCPACGDVPNPDYYAEAVDDGIIFTCGACQSIVYVEPSGIAHKYLGKTYLVAKGKPFVPQHPLVPAQAAAPVLATDADGFMAGLFDGIVDPPSR